MQKYAVYYRRISDGRAPEYVDVGSDYIYFGEMEAENRRDLERRMMAIPDKESKVANTTRRLIVGDVVVENDKEAFIYTPTGAWASVKVVG